MSRRDFLKQISFLTAGFALGFGGLKASNKSLKIIKGGGIEENQGFEKYEFDPFCGQKSSGFKFSAPLPFDFKLIDELALINKKYKKSKLTTLYGSMPDNINPLSKFNSPGRGINPNINTVEDFINFVKYAKNKGFNFVYLFNSPRPFFEEEFEFFRPQFENLLSSLKEIGVLDIKVANQQMLEILKTSPEFNVQASTCFEYTNIRQIQNLLEVYPRVKKFNLATDTNRNIPLLKNLKERFGDVEFELMADEGCIYGCPARISHPVCNKYVFPCRALREGKDGYKYMFRRNTIFPWNLDYYSKIGYKYFKLTGYLFGGRPNVNSVEYVQDYFEAVENGIRDFKFNRLLKLFCYDPIRIENNEVKATEEIIAAFPNLNHFIKRGDKCADTCGVKCNYCISCAENMNKIIPL